MRIAHPTLPIASSRKRRKETRPQELLDAALGLFVEKGFAASKAEEVARRAGVSKGTLYLYYPSKEELFKAVVRQKLSNLIAEGQDLVHNFEGPTSDLLRELMAVCWNRFGNTPDQFINLLEHADQSLKLLPPDARLGVAPHSLRAVTPDALSLCATLRPNAPIHMHLAEQTAEVSEVQAHLGARPVEWVLANLNPDARWCFIHCTQMLPHETLGLATSGAVAGLCPLTEASLGDGIFDGVNFTTAGGTFGIGSDSNIRISLTEELRALDLSQRLRDHSRAALATPDKSTGRVLMESAARGGAQAAGRKSGVIAPGYLADLAALDTNALDLMGRSGDTLLDTWIFAADDRCITDVWSAGRHMVTGGRHLKHDEITCAYRATITRLQGAL